MRRFGLILDTPIVANMERNREWDVTVGGRIESVTDLESFPDTLRVTLAAEPHISVVSFDEPTWPHTTKVVIRIVADKKKDAERTAYEVMLPLFKSAATSVLGDQSFGWTISVDAVRVV